MIRVGLRRYGLLVLAMLPFAVHSKPTLRVAVASNFSSTAGVLFDAFEQRHSFGIVMLVGSSGKHATQIQRGLPVDVFLAADSVRPQWLESNGYALRGSRFTYALGQLALYSLKQRNIDDFIAGNKVAGRHLAVANPKLAPYGKAAFEYLAEQSFNKTAAYQIVKGESVGQAFQFAASGSADLALIAYSQAQRLSKGYVYLVPASSHQAIQQQAVLIRDSSEARSLMRFLKSEDALNIIENAGYLKP